MVVFDSNGVAGVAGLRTVMLLAALEPSAPRARIQTCLVLLGVHANAVEDAADAGALRVLGDVVDLVDGRVRRAVIERATDRERRLAHLALAVARGGGAEAEVHGCPRPWGRTLFDELAVTIDPAVSGSGLDRQDEMLSLTARERVVATIAVRGLSTREIAARAAISPRTVESHLTRIYRKLGVRCRAELAFAYGPR